MARLGDQLRLSRQTGVRGNPLNRRLSYTEWIGGGYLLLLRPDPAPLVSG